MNYRFTNKMTSSSVLGLVLVLLIAAIPQSSQAASDEFSNHSFNHNHLFVVQSSHYYNVAIATSKTTVRPGSFTKPYNKRAVTHIHTRKEVSWYQWLTSSNKTPNLHFLNLLELIGV